MNELSTINSSMKLMNAILLVAFGIIVSFIFLKSDKLWLVISISVILIIAFLYYKKASSNVLELYYDMEYLLLKNKHKTRKIRIEKVKSIDSNLRRIKIFGIPFYQYRISFINENLIRERIFFWISSDDTEIVKFLKLFHSKSKVN